MRIVDGTMRSLGVYCYVGVDHQRFTLEAVLQIIGLEDCIKGLSTVAGRRVPDSASLLVSGLLDQCTFRPIDLCP